MEQELRELLELDENADVLEAVKALLTKTKSEEHKEDTEGMVSLAEYQATESRVAVLEQQLSERDRDEKIADAIMAGKITPAQAKLPVIMTLAEKDPSGFEAFVESQPVIVKLGEVGTSGNEAIELSEAELQLAEKMGVSKEDLLIAKKAEK